jgi:hypothetical protein
MLPAGLSFNSSGTLTGTPTQAGTFPFTAKVTDSSNVPQSAFASFNFGIAVSVGPIQIVSTVLPAAEISSSYSVTLSAIGGTQPYFWSLKTGSLPPGLSLTPSGQLIGTPTQAGNYAFTIQIVDSGAPVQTASRIFTLAVVLNGGPLVVTNVSAPDGQAGVSYSLNLIAAGGTQPYTWSLSSGSLPAGLTLNNAMAKIAGIPVEAGNFSFTLHVADSSPNPQTASKAFTVTIANAVSLVQITTSSLAPSQVNAVYSANLVATGGAMPYSWSISSGALPSGLLLNSSTGQITGTPTASGSSSFTVKVSDATTPTAQTATKSLSITVAVIPPLSITTTSLASGQQGASYNANLDTKGGTAPYMWSISSGSLPPGLNLNASTGTISGTPTVFGAFSFTVKVTDSTVPNQETAIRSLNITVATAAVPLSIVNKVMPDGQQASTYNTTVTASGGTMPYTWSVSVGRLPSGLSLNASTGTISGIPTSSGASTFSLKVVDSTLPTAQTDTASFTITIVPGTSHSVFLTWAPSPSVAATGYNVYRSNVSGTGYAQINSTTVSGLTYSDGTVVSGQTYYYVVTAVDSSGDQSGFSTELQMVIP